MDRTVDELRRELTARGFRGELVAESPLAPHTTWKIGGPAELMATPADVDDVVLAVERAAAAGVAWRVLGNGSNLLVADRGVRGLVIRVRRVLDAVRVEGHTLDVGAGAMLPLVAHRAAAAGLSGLEFGAGIPGTIGGAVIMNAGWHEFEIGNLVRWVDWIGPSGQRLRQERDDCGFRYRGSRFRDERGIVVAANLALEPGDAREIRARLDRFAASRKQNQPTELPSCGSVFLQPPGDFAGRLIEQAGLKGSTNGAAQVSPKHANFIVNLGGATSRQVLELVERVERAVEDRFGVRLVREFEYWR
ncbi:MAG TPA: UDP-N-acetylmuramate dehydrogenase [Candidatus Polarisedimenticolaceae bacterium]|nr:UDP-N-acetylmuramate dehydrogenase [Candidatus Polarisedimenticolaceae bacterium]